ncbi:unnamed protein product [Closterium sp. Yama58-4]|nr:unnamed protein product [Closterium sp. Yama58-4]
MTDSPGFLRLPGSLWAANGGQDSAGEGVIVGVIDTGVWPEHPSFANTPANPYGPVPRRWRGKCQATRDFPRSLCSRKLIGARFFAAGVRKSSAGVNKEKDFLSPRDGDGHGTWCASAAAGNANVPLTLSPTRTLGTISGVAPRARLATYKARWVTPIPSPLPLLPPTPTTHSAAAGNANVPLTLSPSRTLGPISGVAPRARLATYKALWVTPGGGGRVAAAGNANVPLTLSPTRTLGTISGVAPRARLATYKALWVTPGGEAGAFQSDIRAAVDAAVSDGVDVLSCSFGGAISRYFNDLPYLQAFKAGVFIAFAAGNSGAPSKGQMLGTLSNTAPFYLTVGASTIGREYQANLTLGNGVQLTGLGFDSSGNAINLPLVLSFMSLCPFPPLTGLGFGSTGNARDLPLVLSSAAVHPLGTLSLARECFSSSLDKAKLSGRMLVCNLKTRDVREAMKDTATAALGAAAVLLLSDSPSSPAPSRVPYTDVPAIHLNAEDSETVRQYLSKATK